jgi:sugar diacid utilization regulator
MDPLAPYLAFRARSGELAETDDLDAVLGLSPAGAGRAGVAALLESEVTGFSTQPPPRGAMTLIAVGPAVPLAELPASYLAAGRVLAAAETFGLAGLHDLASAGLHAAVIEDADLGDALVELLVEPVRRAAGGEDVLASVREWLAAGMRVEPAAARLFVHPNTVRYRLRRYAELTGAELGETEEALRVWWALQRDLAVAARAEG